LWEELARRGQPTSGPADHVGRQICDRTRERGAMSPLTRDGISSTIIAGGLKAFRPAISLESVGRQARVSVPLLRAKDTGR
jgi:hypothetical protein